MIKKHEEGKCPVCGSQNIEYGEFKHDEESCCYSVECLDCHATFIEVYNMVFDDQYNIEKNKDDENE